MRVIVIPCLRDNYAYLAICEASGEAAVIDPSESKPVLAAIVREGVSLRAIWNTHHHWDHTGGNEALLQAIPGLEVVGHSSDRGRIPGQTRFVEDGASVRVGQELDATVIFNPGHTTGAISYHLSAHDTVFTGDTLFLAGCGRVFEGTFPMMQQSLMRLAALPDNTRVYCGHEYTAANLRFAAAVEPNNQTVAARARAVAELRRQDRQTIPGTIAEERATNPFLRTAVADVAQAANAHARQSTTDPGELFRALRTWKDGFRG